MVLEGIVPNSVGVAGIATPHRELAHIQVPFLAQSRLGS